MFLRYLSYALGFIGLFLIVARYELSIRPHNPATSLPTRSSHAEDSIRPLLEFTEHEYAGVGSSWRNSNHV